MSCAYLVDILPRFSFTRLFGIIYSATVIVVEPQNPLLTVTMFMMSLLSLSLYITQFVTMAMIIAVQVALYYPLCYHGTVYDVTVELSLSCRLYLLWRVFLMSQ